MSAQEVLSTAPATREASDKCSWVLLFTVVIVTSEPALILLKASCGWRRKVNAVLGCMIRQIPSSETGFLCSLVTGPGDWAFRKACPVRTRQRKLEKFSPEKTKLKRSIRWYLPIIKSYIKCHSPWRFSLTMAPPKEGQLPIISSHSSYTPPLQSITLE